MCLFLSYKNWLNRKSIEKINETKSLFFEKINKTNTPLVRLVKREKTQITNVRNESGASLQLLQTLKG